MGFLYLVDLDEYPKEDVVHCIICKTGVGLANDFIDSIDYELTVVFHKMYNVQVDEEKYHRQVNGNTVADTYCVKCGMLLGMKLHNEDLVGGANQQGPNDQDVGANADQNDGANAGQNGGANDQDGAVNEQNDDEDGGAPMN
uniref:Protein yippee-like n=1 Tax=Solanum tuberosum TaxID=4113 RepID=M1DX18_SOLTU